jgi:hypothetical protein
LSQASEKISLSLSIFLDPAPERSSTMEKTNFLYPRSQYRGPFRPELLAFNANLQEFTQKANYICSLQTNGKMSAEKAFAELQDLWMQLEQSKEGLGIG